MTSTVRNFQISSSLAQPKDGAAAGEPTYDIKATYLDSDRQLRYGALRVCTGWSRERIVDKFLGLERFETAFLLSQQLCPGATVQVGMERNDLLWWNR